MKEPYPLRLCCCVKYCAKMSIFAPLKNDKQMNIAIKTISLALLTSTLQLSIAQEKYPYPMDIPVSISASFAELRANHFHAGLDMSTKGVVGVEVHAVADGYVSRIKVSPYGYGHALYISHPDGHTTLYAHLSAYSDKIAQVATAEQYRQKSFEIDLTLVPNKLPVSKGEVVALSGNTGGSGGPHLHFEVRDTKTEEALNPLAFLVPIADSQAPTVYGIKLYALADDAQVAGKTSNRYFSLAEIEGKTINVCGNIGVGVHAVDYFVANQRPCGVVEIKLFDNNNLIFNSVLDSISFDDTRYINSHIDYAEQVLSKRYVQRSFVEPNNKLPVYKCAKQLNISDGETHSMRYELTDFNGNKRVVNFTLQGKRTNASARQHTGYFIDYARTWALDTLGFSVVVPHDALYSSTYADVIVTDISNDDHIYRIGTDQTPLHKPMTLTLPVPQNLLSLGSRLFVAQVGQKSKLTYIASTLSGNQLTAHPRTLGAFTIASDTIPPKVISKNSRTNLKQINNIMIGISDNMSGIKKYNVSIDGEWKCFEYDYKNARLISKVSALGLEAGSHNLEAVIEDECGNQTRWQWTFTVE